MIPDDRKEFDALLAQLCAGYNVPFTEERKQAYWTGLQKLHIAAFTRVVEYSLGEHAPEKFPAVRGLWDLHKILRRQAPPPRVSDSAPPPDITDFAAFANRRLLAFLSTVGGASDASLKRLVEVKTRVTDQVRELLLEEPITEEEFATQLRNEWSKQWDRRLWSEIEIDRRHLCKERQWREPVARPVPRDMR